MKFVAVCSVSDVAPDSAIGLEIDGVPIAVVRTGDDFYAVADLCSHADVPLSEGGEAHNGTVECWLHGSCFDLRTGMPTNPPATEPITVYETTVEAGRVCVRLPLSVRVS